MQDEVNRNEAKEDGGKVYRVAIVGSGPSGFYCAAALFKADVEVEVHMFERLPKPFGLVQFGVAPDHANIRNVIKKYKETAEHESFHFYGNVEVGRDVMFEELEDHFEAVILAYGSATDRRLNIPGEDFERSYTATAFCAWYNGHPDYRDEEFDLTHEKVVIIGQGNVAMDVARVLAKPAAELQETDMATHAVEALSESKVTDIYVVGRRGPGQAKYTPKELGELGEITDCDLVVDPAVLDVGEVTDVELDMPENKQNKRNMKTLRELAEKPTGEAKRRIHLVYYRSPKEVIGEDGRVCGVRVGRNVLQGEPGNQQAKDTGEREVLDCGVLFRSIGYRGVGIKGVPFDEQSGVIPNNDGRVHEGVYAAGWIKRGPSGLIGTNKKCSEETVESLLEDLPYLKQKDEDSVDQLLAELQTRGVRVVSYEDWGHIDRAEIELGELVGKPREHFTCVEEMLAVLG